MFENYFPPRWPLERRCEIAPRMNENHSPGRFGLIPTCPPVDCTSIQCPQKGGSRQRSKRHKGGAQVLAVTGLIKTGLWTTPRSTDLEHALGSRSVAAAGSSDQLEHRSNMGGLSTARSLENGRPRPRCGRCLTSPAPSLKGRRLRLQSRLPRKSRPRKYQTSPTSEPTGAPVTKQRSTPYLTSGPP